ncbi:OmpH family outer membrane protein [Flavobacterium sp. MAH-1]|uniref:OmpH family outer membrane protein n=1 Tax=Flavobacterium agri TaxID=2743471 RepID=A0A7Y9C7Q4_9FLAO|nr:OmpH family outer membrane protein [Flavobacterium agri]NUY81634.1 OmpH family outer membrane protein [Flavobacterium agri]NYA71658.1 OmpH family outer membrane protein [Flavobacterium agri]
MKRILFLLFPAFLLTFNASAQSRGIRVGYIDMEYILKNVPDYAEAKNQLEQKAQGWKQEIAAKQNDINKLKETLKTERVLLTKELIEEREEEIAFQEKELLDYQQKRFGPTGDLITQKAVLVKPIQDQVFTAAQDIAEAKKYDFIFDKSSDMTMLFAAKKFDISDQVIRVLNRAQRREQMSKKELKEEMKKEALEDMVDENPAMEERQKKLDEKKAAREKLIEDRKLAAEAKKKEWEESRARAKAEREAKKNGTAVPATKEATDKTATDKTTSDKTATDKVTPKSEMEEAKKVSDSTKAAKTQSSAEARAKALEDRKKAADERRQKALEAREALKKQKEEERQKAAQPKDSTKTN